MPKKKVAKKKGAEPTPKTLEAALAAITEPKKIPPALGLDALPDLASATRTLPSVKEGVVRALIAGRMPFALARAETTEASRDAMCLALLAMWEKKEFHGRYAWVLDAVAGLGGEQSMVALSGHVSAWPAQGDTGRKRAIAAMRVFVQAESDTAALELLNIRQTAVVPSVIEAVIEAVETVVDRRKTTLSELFDAVTPTLGLDERGTRTFEHQGRTLTVDFDAHLQPRVRDADDANETNIDLEHVPAWTALADEMRDALKVQAFRLEQDMIDGRRWDLATWSRCINEHPLLVTFARRLVWGAYDAENILVTTFRTADDRALLSRDAEVKLPGDARIGVVHPLHLSDVDRQGWAAHLADYEIIQPFPQLGRNLSHTESSETDDTATARFAASRFKSGVLRDVLVRIGWKRDDDFLRRQYERRFPGQKAVAIVTMDPGVEAGMATYDTLDQTVPSIEFREMKGRGKSHTPMRLADVPPVAFSEAVLDVSEALAVSTAS
jgi:hypothetical protein